MTSDTDKPSDDDAKHLASPETTEAAHIFVRDRYPRIARRRQQAQWVFLFAMVASFIHSSAAVVAAFVLVVAADFVLKYHESRLLQSISPELKQSTEHLCTLFAKGSFEALDFLAICQSGDIAGIFLSSVQTADESGPKENVRKKLAAKELTDHDARTFGWMRLASRLHALRRSAPASLPEALIHAQLLDILLLLFEANRRRCALSPPPLVDAAVEFAIHTKNLDAAASIELSEGRNLAQAGLAPLALNRLLHARDLRSPSSVDGITYLEWMIDDKLSDVYNDMHDKSNAIQYVGHLLRGLPREGLTADQYCDVLIEFHHALRSVGNDDDAVQHLELCGQISTTYDFTYWSTVAHGFHVLHETASYAGPRAEFRRGLLQGESSLVALGLRDRLVSVIRDLSQVEAPVPLVWAIKYSEQLTVLLGEDVDEFIVSLVKGTHVSRLLGGSLWLAKAAGLGELWCDWQTQHLWAAEQNKQGSTTKSLGTALVYNTMLNEMEVLALATGQFFRRALVHTMRARDALRSNSVSRWVDTWAALRRSVEMFLRSPHVALISKQAYVRDLERAISLALEDLDRLNILDLTEVEFWSFFISLEGLRARVLVEVIRTSGMTDLTSVTTIFTEMEGLSRDALEAGHKFLHPHAWPFLAHPSDESDDDYETFSLNVRGHTLNFRANKDLVSMAPSACGRTAARKQLRRITEREAELWSLLQTELAAVWSQNGARARVVDPSAIGACNHTSLQRSVLSYYWCNKPHERGEILYAVMVLVNNKVRRCRVITPDAKDLAERISRFKRLCSQDFVTAADLLDEGYSLFNILLHPFWDLVNSPHLTIVPSGALLGFPFEVLCSDRSVAAPVYVGEKLSLSYQPTALFDFARYQTDDSDNRTALSMAEIICCESFDSAKTNAELRRTGQSSSSFLHDLRALSRISKWGPSEVSAQEFVHSPHLGETSPQPRWPELPMTTDEGELVSSLLQAAGVVTRRRPGTRAEFLRALETTQDTTLLHLATHGLPRQVGLSRGGPIRGALLFSPDDESEAKTVLTTEELLESKGSLDHLQLVVLSACATADGEDVGLDGRIGLCQALLMRGVRAVIAASWELEDAFCALFMREFYRALVAQASATDALRAARVFFINHSEWGHPRYWAGFTLHGLDVKFSFRRDPINTSIPEAEPVIRADAVSAATRGRPECVPSADLLPQ